VHQLVGVGTSDVYKIHNASGINTLRGLVERVFTVDYKQGKGFEAPIRVSSVGFNRAVKPAMAYLRKSIFQISKMTEEQFIGHYKIARLRNRYINASAALKVKSVERKDANVQTFVKADKVNVTVKGDSCPRIISPRDPRYNLALGVYIKAIEGVLYTLLNGMCGGTTVMKGLNAVEVGGAIHEMWNQFGDPVAIPFDAVRFDQHTHTSQLKYEHKIYKMFYAGGDKQELAKLLSWQLKNFCKSFTPEAIISCITEIRCSGDMNTGLGTCLIACSIVYSFCKEYDIKFRLANNGDDCVLICERSDLEVVQKWLHPYCKTAGYWFEVEPPVFRLEHISFCQAHPVYTERGWTMVRDFPTCITKDCTSLLPLKDEKSWRKWANDVGKGGMALCAGVPVLYSFYEKLAGLGNGTFGAHPNLHGTGFSYLSARLDTTRVHISPDARISFWEAFGMSPEYQKSVEKRLEQQLIFFDRNLKGYQYTLDTDNSLRHSLNSFIIDYKN
jgi:hypothetical protein